MNISVMPAKEAKNSFWNFINTAQREPVVVTKKNKPVWVFLSIKDLSNYKEISEKIEIYFNNDKKENPFLDMLWINRENKSFNNTVEVDDFINNLRKEWI